jgi:hypothetical protein
METRHEWGKRVAAVVGGEVARFRTRRQVEHTEDGPRLTEPMTLQQLSDRCAALGYPIARSVLSKLEKKHRHTITLDEVLVLAQALGVPAVLLMFPLSHAETVEALPGKDVSPWNAIAWFQGTSGDLDNPWADPQLGTNSPIHLWGAHEEFNSMLPVNARHVDETWAKVAAATTDDGREMLRDLAKGAQARLDDSKGQLRAIRVIMRELGPVLPPLHPETARILGEEE